MSKPLELFKDFVENFKREFPNISTQFILDDPEYIVFNIPKQEGLQFHIHTNLQNRDEFHLGVGDEFHCSWFPCTDSDAANSFTEIVKAIVRGRIRVMEFYRNGKCYKAHLEAYDQNRWVKIAFYSKLFGFSLPWGNRSTKTLLNGVNPQVA